MKFRLLVFNQVVWAVLLLAFCSRSIMAESTDKGNSTHQLVITEIMYNPPEAGTDTLEFIELYNAGNYPVNLEGFQFTEGVLHVFEAQILNPGQYIVLSIDDAAFFSTFGLQSLQWNSGRLTNTGELLKLVDNTGNTVDSVVYGISIPWPSTANGYGPSLSVVNPFADNGDPTNWIAAQDFATTNMANDTIWANPMAGNSNWTGNPESNFWASQTAIFTNNAIDFFDVSSGNPISWQWSFEGGTPSVSSLQNPVGIVYHQAGTFQVCLTVTNANGSDIKCLQGYIHVTDSINAALVISEIMYNPPESTDSLEYIEIFNKGSESIDLTNFYFSKGIEFVFPQQSIPAGGFVVVCQNAEAISNTFGIQALQWTSGSLNNLGEPLVLNDKYGIIVDSITYGISPPWDTLAAGLGSSLVLCDPFLDNQNPANWIHAVELAAINAANENIYGSPGSSCLLTHPLASFLASQTTTIPGNPISFVDNSQGYVAQRQWYFEGGSPSVSNLSNPSVTYSQPGDYRVCLKVWNVYGADSTCQYGYIHVMGAIDHGIVITEIMYNSPDSNTDSLDFIEIYNSSNQAVNLEGFQFASGINFIFPAVQMQPASYVVIAKYDTVIERFFNIPALKWTSGELINSGELVLLKDSYGFVVDSVAYDDALPWDTLADGFGHSLVLCNPFNNNSIPESWLHAYDSAGILANGTPVYANPGRGCNLVEPIANFVAASTYNFIDNPVGFTDLSLANPTSWLWEFEGGDPPISNLQQPPAVQYHQAGVYNVCLTVYNTEGSNKLCKENYIYVVPEGSASLKITEIMYNPPDVNVDTLEFIELKNTGEIPIDLNGFAFTKGVLCVLPRYILKPDSLIIISKDAEWMRTIFGVESIQWAFGSNLNNSGELIELVDKSGFVIDSVFYDQKTPWPAEANGTGRSLTLCNPLLDGQVAQNWLASQDIAAIKPNGDTIWATPGYGCSAGKPAFRIDSDYKIVGPGGTVTYAYVNLNWPANQVEWSFEGGSPQSSTLWNPQVSYPALGAYSVTVSASNAFGQTQLTFPEYIEVKEGIGISEADDAHLHIWPNPSTGIVNIRHVSVIETIEVVNLAGMSLTQVFPNSKMAQLALSALPNGMYFVKILLENGKTASKKLILQSE